MWYRASGPEAEGDKHLTHNFTAYAESDDGIEWERPNLELIEFDGSTENNLCLADPDVRNISVFQDPDPDVSDEERYKAVGKSEDSGSGPAELYAVTSPDGVSWERLDEEPLITAPADDPQFDSPVNVFWDGLRERYVIYVRGWYPDGPQRRIRAIRMTSSEDFREWSDWEYITIEGWNSWREHLYTNSAHRYYRAPYYLMFPKRFLPERQADPDWSHTGLSDVLLLASRDGEAWTQVGDDAFLRPGHDPNNWHDRAIYLASNTVRTGDGKMSLYALQNYRTEEVHIRRYTLREDGFVSAHAGRGGGTLVTKPLAFDGDRLEVNYATSAAGVVRVGLLDADGRPIEGYSAAACEDLIGDEIDTTVTWASDPDVSDCTDDPVRLRFELEEADLYSFKFSAT
jgi:hypothetical protein